MIAKAGWALLPIVFFVEQDSKLCTHRDGRGETQAIDVAAIERAYAEKFSAVVRVETAPILWKKTSLPACPRRETRRVEIAPVAERLVGKKWVFSGEPISPEACRWFHVRCATSTVTIVDRTHLEIVEE
jgi:hypothetical protein